MTIESVLKQAGSCALWVRWGRRMDRSKVSPQEAFESAMAPSGPPGEDERIRFATRSMLRAYVILPLLIRRNHPEWWDEYQRLRLAARCTTTWAEMEKLIPTQISKAKSKR